MTSEHKQEDGLEDEQILVNNDELSINVDEDPVVAAVENLSRHSSSSRSSHQSTPSGQRRSAQTNGSLQPPSTRLRRVESQSSSRSSHQDLPNQMGNTGRPTNEANTFREMYGPGETPPSYLRERWEINYREAAIFLEEGVNNDKFTHHPRCKEDLPAYLLVHNRWFNLLDLAASLVILLLGLVEKPCDPVLSWPTQVHASVELCALVLISVQVFLRSRWIGYSNFYKHKRTCIKVITLGIMLIEAIVVIIRNDSHIRITRCLRPLFLVDNYFCGGVRRFIRQILQSLPPIIDMLILVFFVMLIYSVFGFYLFSDDDNVNFGNLSKSFVSLFVLLTTANYPDVMMRSYHKSSWAAGFFISYLSINLYFLMNLLLAVVYDAFTRIEKEKFRRLFLHKRKAAQHAFKLLVTKENPDGIHFKHFLGLMRFYKGIKSPTEAFLIFKMLKQASSSLLTLDEFYGVFDACVYNWSVAKVAGEWYDQLWPPFAKACDFLNKVVRSTWFEYTICLVVLTNGIILVVQTWVMNSASDQQTIYAEWVSYFFVGLYTLEASLKLLGLGYEKYFSSYWNIFDFIVTCLGIASLVLQWFNCSLFYVILLRPLRLLTLFRMKKRFRDVFGTAIILFPRLTSAIIVLILIYYFFAIIGMESFQNLSHKLKNCCVNTTVESYYKFVQGEESTNMYFYENNFLSLPRSGVTLFELTVVNNWYVIMEGFVHVAKNDYPRVFFMTFYIFTMIVMTIIVAFILEAFLFRIQYKELLSKQDEMRQLVTEIELSSDELENVVHYVDNINMTIDQFPENSIFRFIGVKSRTKEQLQLMMYAEEMEQWLTDARLEEEAEAERAQQALLRDGSRDGEDDTVQVVQDEGEVTTIHRHVLTDFHSFQR